MEIQSPRSTKPEVFDNTEKELILVSPSVLERLFGKFGDFLTARASIGNDLAVGVALAVPLASSDFHSVLGIPGATIQGAMFFGLLVVAGKIVVNIVHIKRRWRTHNREAVIQELLQKPVKLSDPILSTIMDSFRKSPTKVPSRNNHVK